MFTDVEGSTELWDQVPEAMSSVLKVHDAIIRDQIERFDGYEVKTEGDAFMVAFGRPQMALEWCMACQTELLGATWPDDLLRHEKAAALSSPTGMLFAAGCACAWVCIAVSLSVAMIR